MERDSIHRGEVLPVSWEVDVGAVDHDFDLETHQLTGRERYPGQTGVVSGGG